MLDSDICDTAQDGAAAETEELDDENFEIDVETPPKRKKRDFVNVPSTTEVFSEDDMPRKWCHIRDSERKVKPEFYRAVDKLVSEYHCSKSQAVAAIIVCGNHMFGRNWKDVYDDPEQIDLDTAPSLPQIRASGRAIEVLAIKDIVEEIMQSNETVITYHDDGSKKKSVGSFMVQGVTIDGVFRAFPALPIASESRENLAKLKSTVLHILEICSGVPGDGDGDGDGSGNDDGNGNGNSDGVGNGDVIVVMGGGDDDAEDDTEKTHTHPVEPT